MSVKLPRREFGWGNFNKTWQGVIKDHLREENLGIEKIENIQFLSELDFHGYTIKSLESLKYLPQIEDLYMSQTEVKDPAPLRFLPNLRTLNACYSVITDWRILEHASQLEVLDISFPRFSRKLQLPRFDRMPKLRELYINGCSIRDLKSLGNIQQLDVLSLNFNHIKKEELSNFSVRNEMCKIIA